MQRGYIKFWRKAMDSCTWSRGLEFRGLLLTLLEKANHKPGFFLGREIDRGQLAVSVSAFAVELGITRAKLQRMIKVLESDGVILSENSSNRYTVITIVNYSKYQDVKYEGRATDNTTGELPASTIKECKNINTRSSLREDLSAAKTTDEEQGQFEITGDSEGSHGTAVVPECDYQALCDLYRELLPELPGIRTCEGSRKKHMRARWRETWARLKKAGKPCEKADLLAWWRKFFEAVRESDFLMGRVEQRGRVWAASIDFLVSPNGYTGVLEGKYANKRAA